MVNTESPLAAAVALTHRAAVDWLLARSAPTGPWRGQLASGALATALAAFALARAGEPGDAPAVRRAGDWLVQTQNPDGGWGDTPGGPSRLATTLLAWATLGAVAEAPGAAAAVTLAAGWLERRAGGLEPAALARAVTAAYGDDRTFAAPILTVLALAGRLGPDASAWLLVHPLPFEAAVLPHGLLRRLRLGVVSYALPALVAIGLVRHRFRPGRGPRAWLRTAVTATALRRLRAMQPASGGYLEATPLTAFVALGLAAAGETAHPVTAAALRFLRAGQRPDGSWPIDTDLATWVTTLAVNALPADALTAARRRELRDWLLGQQGRDIHPFTRAAPGGWAWSDRSGAVPDADDTAGALLALHRLADLDGAAASATAAAAGRGLDWLLDLQNADGGLPTFCRGWGRLPFDRSCPELTAHALRAFAAWRPGLPPPWPARLGAATRRALEFLARSRRPDGAWQPLWFGNQAAPDEHNLTWGTAHVLLAAQALDLAEFPVAGGLAAAARDWLGRAQNEDGGWGGAPGVPSSVEETGLALSALAGAAPDPAVLRRGAAWLTTHTDMGRTFPAAPLGLYFASLWYAEELYPVIFTVAALDRLRALPAFAAAAPANATANGG